MHGGINLLASVAMDVGAVVMGVVGGGGMVVAESVRSVRAREHGVV